MTIDNRVSSLGPPRGGRVVRNAEDVIREIEAQSKDPVPETEIEQQVAPEFNPSRSLPKSRADVFSFSDLRFDSVDTLTLYDLEVPEGKWEQLSLVHGGYGGIRLAGHDKWVQYSAGHIDVGTGVSEFVPKTHTPEAHIVTSKAFYWFLRAAYELRNDFARRMTTDKIRDLSPSPGRFMRNIVTAEKVTHDVSPLGRKWMNISTVGWELGHPLLIDYEYNKPLPLAYALEGNSAIELMIYHLLGDPDPSRVLKVFSWISQSNEIGTIDLTDIQNPGDGVIFFNLQHSKIQIIPRNEPHITLGLIAKPSRFKPYGGRP